jgi:hypothetical protein
LLVYFTLPPAEAGGSVMGRLRMAFRSWRVVR